MFLLLTSRATHYNSWKKMKLALALGGRSFTKELIIRKGGRIIPRRRPDANLHVWEEEKRDRKNRALNFGKCRQPVTFFWTRREKKTEIKKKVKWVLFFKIARDANFVGSFEVLEDVVTKTRKKTNSVLLPLWEITLVRV